MHLPPEEHELIRRAFHDASVLLPPNLCCSFIEMGNFQRSTEGNNEQQSI